MNWRIESRNKYDGSIVITNGNVSHLLMQETDPKLKQDSGWYILRTVTKGLQWVDRARPGYGVTCWITIDAAESLGLIKGKCFYRFDETCDFPHCGKEDCERTKKYPLNSIDRSCPICGEDNIVFFPFPGEPTMPLYDEVLKPKGYFECLNCDWTEIGYVIINV